jgi:hypothetical protein
VKFFSNPKNVDLNKYEEQLQSTIKELHQKIEFENEQVMQATLKSIESQMPFKNEEEIHGKIKFIVKNQINAQKEMASDVCSKDKDVSQQFKDPFLPSAAFSPLGLLGTEVGLGIAVLPSTAVLAIA